MKIKYLLSGRLLSDMNHLRKIQDSWPDNITFPEIVENLESIDKNDKVLTYGYLGQSAYLIKNHNPNKVFILDNAIFPSKGISKFRILNGNLDSFCKNTNSNSSVYKDYYEKKIIELIARFVPTNKELKLNTSNQKNQSNSKITEFPWSIPLKKLINFKNKNEIDRYEEKTNFILAKNNYKVSTFFKNGAIENLTTNHLPFCRNKNAMILKENNIKESKLIFCPSSTLAILGLLTQKDLVISKYNPYQKFLKENQEFKKYKQQKLLKLTSLYIDRINFSIADLYNII